MSSKTGRNDPCPCGSGKKYKKCCMDSKDNVIPFPVAGFSDDKLKKYNEMVENHDPADGPVPTFMEYMGKPNLATESLHGLTLKIGDRVFNSEEELKAFADQHMRSSNNEPQKDFLGLSPSQMHSILHKNVSDNTSLMDLNDRVSQELLEGAPVMKQCRFLLRTFSESEDGIRATQRGNFPRKLVQEFYEKFVREHDILERRPMQEDDVEEISKQHFFLKQAGLVRKHRGMLSLTKKGDNLLKETPFQVYKTLFQFFSETFYWLSGTHYPDNVRFIQDSLLFSLYITRHKAADFKYVNELADYFKTAFPQFVDEVNSINGFDIFSNAYCHMFFDDFAWQFGLVEKKGDKRAFLSKEIKYRKTELFDEIFVWKI
jgi:hypothetical protein